MESILIIITALIFYLLGRFSGREIETAKKLQKQIKRKLHPPVTGVIDYPTPRQLEYEGSEEQKADQDREALWKKHLNASDTA